MNDSILNSSVICPSCGEKDVTLVSCCLCDKKQCTICDDRKPCIKCDNLFCPDCIIENELNGYRYCFKCLDIIDIHADRYKLIIKELKRIGRAATLLGLQDQPLSFKYGLLEGEIKGLLNRFSL